MRNKLLLSLTLGLSLVAVLTISWYVLSPTTKSSNLSKLSSIDLTNKSCSDCHIQSGDVYSASNGLLAGQDDLYLTKQLTDFKTGARSIEHLNSSIHKLTNTDIKKYSQKFSAQPRQLINSEGSNKGKQLYNRGDDDRQIPACMSCHVINGHGIPDATLPALSGQSNEYIVKQLELFRSGERTNDTNYLMRKIAVRLTNEDIEALALHITSLK
jgi:cytochrome c553